jgi:hypothetical protein
MIVGGVVWVAYQVFWHATRTPAPTVDYATELIALSAAGQPEGTNGWPMLANAMQTYSQVEGQIDQRAFASRDAYEMSRTPAWNRIFSDPLQLDNIEKEKLALQLLREQGCFDLLAQAARCPRMIQPIMKGSPLIIQPLPTLTLMRQLCKARIASMRLAAIDGDFQEVIDGYDQTMTLSRASAAQPALISYLVGLGIADALYTEIRCQLLEHDLDAQTCRQLLDRLDTPPPTTQRALTAERLTCRDTIQTVFTDDGHGDGQLDLSSLSGLTGGGAPFDLPGQMGSIFLAGRRETTALVDAYYDQAIQQSAMPVQERASAHDSTMVVIDTLTERHLFARRFLSSIDKVVQNFDQVHMKFNATRIMLALQIYRARRGAYPATLDELAPGILPAIPVDPMNGGPFEYRREGDGYHLSSRGPWTDPAFPEDDTHLSAPRSTWQW